MDMIEKSMETLGSGLSRVKSIAESNSGNSGIGGGAERNKNFSILECKSVQELKKIGKQQVGLGGLALSTEECHEADPGEEETMGVLDGHRREEPP